MGRTQRHLVAAFLDLIMVDRWVKNLCNCFAAFKLVGLYRVSHRYVDTFGLNFEIFKIKYICQKVRLILKFLGKRLLDETLKSGKIKLEVFLN